MTDSVLNQSLDRAKALKYDEFYTQLSDIENELKHYRKHFKDQVVYCNCDDPRISGFFHYFSYNFEKLGLKKLTAACYKNQALDLFSKHDVAQAIYLTYEGDKTGTNVPELDDIGVQHFEEDGDFRSAEAIELLEQADVVATNPPFSLFQAYVAQLLQYDKKFVIIGPKNSITYRSILPLIMENRMWLGYGFQGGNAFFKTPNPEGFAKGVYDEKTGLIKFRNVSWFTNLDIAKRHEELILYRTYDPGDYPSYVNYGAIEVSRVKDIPVDFEGHMGVPITFLDYHNPDQFEIVGSSMTHAKPMAEIAEAGTYTQGGPRFYLDSGDGTYKRLFDRIVIRNKRL